MKPAVLASLAALSLAACATQAPAPSGSPDMGHAIQQPMRDLSLIQEQAHPALKHAVADPYATAGVSECAETIHEIALLDTALGPDLKPGGEKAKGMIEPDSLAVDLVQGAVGFPFRGVVRTVTGADRRDRELRAAVLAGMVRRGFLKGRLSEMTCAPAAPPAAHAPTSATPVSGPQKSGEKSSGD